MKKTISYFLNKRKLFIGVCLGITLLFTLEIISNRAFYYEFGGEKVASDMPFGFLYLYGIIFSSVIPVMEFKFKTNKIMVDQAYSLPIKREKYYFAKYIFGLIEVLLPIAVCGVVSFIYVMCSRHIYNLGYVIIYILILLLLSASVYSIFVFFFIKGNTVFDGIMNMFFASCFLMTLISAIDTYIDIHNIFGYGSESFIYSTFIYVYNFFNNLAKGGTIDLTSNRYGLIALVPSLIYFVLGIISVFGIIISSKNEKAEDATQISDSWFSYKTFIPAYLFLIMFGNYADFLLFVLIILTAGYIGYIMYRKTVKIKKIDLIILFASTFIGLILGNILYSLK